MSRCKSKEFSDKFLKDLIQATEVFTRTMMAGQ